MEKYIGPRKREAYGCPDCYSSNWSWSLGNAVFYSTTECLYFRNFENSLMVPSLHLGCKYPGHFRNPWDCASFIQCDDHGKAHYLHCPYGTIFNQKIGVCVHYNRYTKYLCKHGYPHYIYGYKKNRKYHLITVSPLRKRKARNLVCHFVRRSWG